MAEPQRLADLAFGERLLAGHEVRLDAGDRGGHAPGRAHVAPRLRQLDADGLGGRAGRPVGFGRRRAVGGVRARTATLYLRLDSSLFIGHNLLCESSTLGTEVTMDVLANDGPTRRPSDGRIGALASVTPIVMFGAWIAISGWSGTVGGLVVALTQITLGAVAAGWIVGGRIGGSFRGRVLGFVAYAFVAWLVLLPLNVVGSAWEDVQSGRTSDLGEVVLSTGGYLLYGTVLGIYALVFLLPFGAGWIVTFTLIRRVFDR